MAFTSILRKSAISAAPLALRFVGRSRHHTSAVLFSAVKLGGGASPQQLRRSFFPSTIHFSTAAAKAESSDEKLIKFLKAEIDCAEEPEEVADVPAGFPFKIEDNPGEQMVKLIRQFNGETIEVEVYMPDLAEYDDEDDKDNDDSENSQQSNLPLTVKISKDAGPTLEFSCSATADEVNIDSLSVKDPEASDDLTYDGPDFGDLDENLQKAFHKYLNVRGITPHATNYLHDYMINKDAREYKMWLKNLKKFVEA